MSGSRTSDTLSSSQDVGEMEAFSMANLHNVSSSQGPASRHPSVEAPSNWMTTVNNIRKMRLTNPAPVDTMGCERCADPNAVPRVQRFQTLISLLLSSQTKDEVTYAAMDRLKKYGLTVEQMMEIDLDELKGLLKPVGFYNRKAEYIKKVVKILKEEYESDIPKMAADLQKLPGIGPKMAFICASVAFGQNEGIGVDTHVHRISERLGWTSLKGKKNTPENTRKQLEAWLPKELWQDINILLVGFGQTICQPTKPKCGECLNNTSCPFGIANSKSLAAGPSSKRVSSVKTKAKKDRDSEEEEEIEIEDLPKRKKEKSSNPLPQEDAEVPSAAFR